MGEYLHKLLKCNNLLVAHLLFARLSHSSIENLSTSFNFGKSLISVFQEFFASIAKIFILAGDWALGYHFMEFWDFPDIS